MTKKKKTNNSDNNEPSGIFHNYDDLLSFFKYKSGELRGCGFGLKLTSNTIYFQFTDSTGKRKQQPWLDVYSIFPKFYSIFLKHRWGKGLAYLIIYSMPIRYKFYSVIIYV